MKITLGWIFGQAAVTLILFIVVIFTFNYANLLNVYVEGILLILLMILFIINSIYLGKLIEDYINNKKE